jgi:hypothetical protein
MRPFLLLLAVASPTLAQQAPPAWQLSASPTLTLGGPTASGPTEFSNPYDGAFWGSRLVILDGATQSLRVFSLRDGSHLATYGRKGAGPGEFSNAAYIQPFGDSVFVSDIQQSRYTVFDSEGHVARVVSFAALRTGSRTTPLGRLADGSILAWAVQFQTATGSGLQPIPATIFRVSVDGTRADSLGTLPFTTVQPMSFGGNRGWRVAFGAGQLYPAIGPDLAYFTSPTRYLLYTYSVRNGWSSLEQAVPIRLSRPKDVEAIRKDAVDHGAAAQLMAQVGMVDTLPAIVLTKVAPSGRVFVVDAPIDSAQMRRGITVFAAGRPIGRFYIPAGLVPLAISDSLIALTERDPDDAPSIQVFAIKQ